MQPSSAVTGSVVIIVGTTLIRRIREGKSQGHIIEVIIFGFLLLVALLLLAIVMPEVAKVLAMLGLVGAFVVNGPSVFEYLGNFGRNADRSMNERRVTER